MTEHRWIKLHMVGDSGESVMILRDDQIARFERTADTSGRANTRVWLDDDERLRYEDVTEHIDDIAVMLDPNSRDREKFEQLYRDELLSTFRTALATQCGCTVTGCIHDRLRHDAEHLIARVQQEGDKIHGEFYAAATELAHEVRQVCLGEIMFKGMSMPLELAEILKPWVDRMLAAEKEYGAR